MKWCRAHLPVHKDNLAVHRADRVVVQPDAARWVAPKRNLLVVDRVRGDDLVGLEPLHEAQRAEPAHLARVHLDAALLSSLRWVSYAYVNMSVVYAFFVPRSC